MEQIAAANFEGLFQVRNHVFEAVGIEWCGIEQEESELADHVARGVAGEDGVSFDRLQDPSGVVLENELKETGEAGKIDGMRAEKGGGVFTEGEMFG